MNTITYEFKNNLSQNIIKILYYNDIQIAEISDIQIDDTDIKGFFILLCDMYRKLININCKKVIQLVHKSELDNLTKIGWKIFEDHNDYINEYCFISSETKDILNNIAVALLGQDFLEDIKSFNQNSNE